MKKIIYAIFALLTLWACDSNEIKMFGSGDTNAYFPETMIGVAVGNTVSIPLNVAGVQGSMPVDVKVHFADSTAVRGVDYLIHSGDNYHFAKGMGTEYIVVEALPKNDDVMAKRVFTITLETPEEFQEGVRNTMTVEIRNYSKHPLRQLLGDAVFKGVELVQGNVMVETPVNIYPDDNDELVLWLSGMSGASYAGILPDLQLVVDTNARTITIPYQSFPSRTLGGKTGNIETFRGEVLNNQVYITEKTDALLKYDKDGNIYFQDWFGVWWTSGSEEGQPLFIYYGNFGGGYNTVIVKPAK